MDSSPLFLATSGPTKRRKHYFCLLFSQYWTWAEKSQWSRHLFEKSIPGLFYSKPPRKVSATELELRTTKLKKPKKNRPTCFQTLTFCRNLSFQKSWICPWIFQGFPTPWISHPMDFGFSGRPRERPTKTKIGRRFRFKPNSAEPFPTGSDANLFEPFLNG